MRTNFQALGLVGAGLAHPFGILFGKKNQEENSLDTSFPNLFLSHFWGTLEKGAESKSESFLLCHHNTKGNTYAGPRFPSQFLSSGHELKVKEKVLDKSFGTGAKMGLGETIYSKKNFINQCEWE